MNNLSKTKSLVLAALFAAITFYLTMLHINTGYNQAYIHLGDATIYLAATLLPQPYGMVSAAIGAGLADFTSGAMIWVIPTIMIKPLMCSFFTNKSSKILNKRNFIASIISGTIMIVGYYLAEGIIFSNFISPIGNVIFNIIQATGSLIVFIILAYIIDKTKLKEKHLK